MAKLQRGIRVKLTLFLPCGNDLDAVTAAIAASKRFMTLDGLKQLGEHPVELEKAVAAQVSREVAPAPNGPAPAQTQSSAEAPGVQGDGLGI